MQPGPGLFLSGNDLQVCRRVDVLPELAASLHHSKLPTVQFHRNGAVRITLKKKKKIKFQSVGLRSRLVFLRDLPCEVPDAEVRAFLPSFGEDHSIVAYHHKAFPDILNGTHMVKMTFVKDTPSSVRLAGFE